MCRFMIEDFSGGARFGLCALLIFMISVGAFGIQNNYNPALLYGIFLAIGVIGSMIVITMYLIYLMCERLEAPPVRTNPLDLV